VSSKSRREKGVKEKRIHSPFINGGPIHLFRGYGWAYLRSFFVLLSPAPLKTNEWPPKRFPPHSFSWLGDMVGFSFQLAKPIKECGGKERE